MGLLARRQPGGLVVPDNLSVLTDSDVAALRDIIARVKRSPGPRGGDILDTIDLDYSTPEVYLAKAPDGGLPAASGGILGVADCQIYRALPFSGGTTEALGYGKTVYNPGSSTVAPGTLFLATRDKFGVWYCSVPGGVSGVGNTINLVTNVCPLFTSGVGTAPSGVKVEYTPVTIPGATVGTPFCADNPDTCCPVSTPCCPGVMMPSTLYATVSGSQSACMNGTFTLTYHDQDPTTGITNKAGAGWYSEPVQCTGGPTNTQVHGTVRWLLQCVGSVWHMTLLCYDSTAADGWVTVASGFHTTSNCSPVSLSGSSQSHSGQGSPCITPPPVFGPFIVCSWTVTE
jgi:hypothetical protein